MSIYFGVLSLLVLVSLSVNKHNRNFSLAATSLLGGLASIVCFTMGVLWYFEHYIFMELNAYIGIKELDCKIQYWRSKTGLEVDFILGDGKIAIEVKISENPSNRDFKGLNAFCDDYAPKKAIVVCLAPRKRLINNKILVLPWQIFLDDLWGGKILSDITV